MTKFRRKPATRFHAFLVQPNPEFEPRNWQQTPRHYRIVQYVGVKQFLGGADSWKFVHNHAAMESGDVSTWAIYLDFETPMFDDSPTGTDSRVAAEAAPVPSRLEKDLGRMSPLHSSRAGASGLRSRQRNVAHGRQAALADAERN